MKLYFLVFLVGILVGCKRGAEVPQGVLPPNKMQQVLWEVMKADELVAHYAADPTKNRFAMSVAAYNQVFAKQGITKEIFEKSMDWYTAHPDVMRTLLDSLKSKHPTTNY